MTASKPLGTYGDGAGTVTPLDHKLAQSGLMAKTSTVNLVRTGVFYNGTSTIVSGTANMSYDVAAFTAALTRGATAGTVLLANDATYNVVTTAAPGSNSRYDVVYVWAREFTLDGTDSNPVIGVVQGVAAASPTVPSLAAYPGALELARIIVPAGVTATNSGTTITQKAPFTAAAGGVLPFRTTTEQGEGTFNEGQLGWLIDSNTIEAYTGSAWSDPGGRIYPTSVAGSGVTLSKAVVSASASSTVSVNGCFTSAYTVYEVTYDLTCSGVASLGFQLRVSGSSAATAYDSQRTATVNATDFPAQALNATSVLLDAQALAGKHSGVIRLYNPALAVATTGTAVTGGSANPMTTTTGLVQTTFISHRTTTAYDGFTLTPSTGNVTGTVSVRGIY
jgi:hypothetical protein